MTLSRLPDAAYLAAIVASADDAIISKDLSGTITSWNPAAEALFGYTEKEAVGRNILMIIPQDRVSEEDFVLSRIRSGNAVSHFETVRQRKDGSLVEVLLTVSPVRDATGRVIGASKIARDLSLRRQMERVAFRLAAIVDSSDDAIVSKDLKGTIQTWNPAAERIFGYTAAEAIGRSITIIIPADRQLEETEVLSRIAAGELVDHFETIRQRKDGELVDVSLTVSPIKTPDGTVIGASKIARDITEQKRLRRVVEEASRSKDEFLAVLSHELRTPLNTVLGYAHMLRLEDMALTGERRAKALEILERNADTLARLVNDVLDTSRAITGKLRLNVEELRLNEVLRQAMETIQPTADAKRVKLSADIAEDLRLFGDRDRLQQITWNLLANAVRFTPPGGEVTLRAFHEAPDIVLQVVDTGVGIAAEHLPFIFQRFWQVESGPTRENSGLGIGLAFVRYLVELHGGFVKASSEGLGRGATVTVRLPALTMPKALLAENSTEPADKR
jgi:PAS domain S-box-containing protein